MSVLAGQGALNDGADGHVQNQRIRHVADVTEVSWQSRDFS